jgi:uncharacterized protein
MTTPTGTGPPSTPPTPPGWPGDDPTVPEELGALGRRKARPVRPTPRRRQPAERRPRPDDPGTGRPARAARPVRPEDELAPRRRADADDELEPRRRVRSDDHGTRRPDRDEPVPARESEHAALVVGDADTGELDLDGRPIAPARVDPEAGTQPAGRVLVVMVAALLLAMLVNADVLVERADRKPLGPERDRELAVWHPVQDVSHALQLHRVRQVADWLAGNDDDNRGGSPVPAATPETEAGREQASRTAGEAGEEAAPDSPPITEAAGPPELRTPTAAEPLRLWVGGDSMAEIFGRSLVSQSEATGVIAPTLHYEVSSGLVRPDYYNWPGAMAEDLAAHDPEVVVTFFGANDGQGIVLPDGTPVQDVSDPRWLPEYRRRVGALMDQLRAGDRLVVWLGQPPMRDAGFGSRMALVNQAAMAEAATRPWVVFVDTAPLLGDANRAFAELLPDASGSPTDMRQDDGIHLTRAAGDLLAAHVLDVVRAHVDLSGQPARPDPA